MRRIIYGLLGFNALLFLGALALGTFSLVVYHPWAAAQETPAGAQPGTTAQPTQASGVGGGNGLGLLGVALATLGSTIGAGLALGPVGAATIGAVTEKPEMFGRSLVIVGLAEGIAIYGIIISIMILGKL